MPARWCQLGLRLARSSLPVAIATLPDLPRFLPVSYVYDMIWAIWVMVYLRLPSSPV